MRSAPNTHIDFDEWARLAAEDPAAFERRRAEVIDDFIAHAPPERRQRLRGLQWRIDGVRKTAANPTAACIRISSMMWDSVLGENGLLESLEALRAPRCGPAPRAAGPERSADIIPLDKRSR